MTIGIAAVAFWAGQELVSPKHLQTPFAMIDENGSTLAARPDEWAAPVIEDLPVEAERRQGEWQVHFDRHTGQHQLVDAAGTLIAVGNPAVLEQLQTQLAPQPATANAKIVALESIGK